jgi:hypothetical protein
MHKRAIDAIDDILLILTQAPEADYSAFLGFDACIDIIARIVRKKNTSTGIEYFSDSGQFGEYLINLGNKSGGIELRTKLSKIGGNMVITGNALGNLGIKVECVGTFGIPEILPVFRTISSNCSLHTVADTITATALEFNDSKVIMFDPGPYDHLNWNSLKMHPGLSEIKELISGRRLVAFLNWSEIESSSEIWQGFLNEILPSCDFSPQKNFFFTDLSDCSRKSKEEIQFATELLDRFRKYFTVVLSLNQNEANLVAEAIGLRDYSSDEEFVRQMFNNVNTDILVLHRLRDALAFDGMSFERCETFYCEDPAILTGGGDNFNAGFCFSLIHNPDLYQALLVANAVSGIYVETGSSPSFEKLVEFLQKITGK